MVWLIKPLDKLFLEGYGFLNPSLSKVIENNNLSACKNLSTITTLATSLGLAQQKLDVTDSFFNQTFR